MLDFLFPAPQVPSLLANPYREDNQTLRSRDLEYIDAIHAACLYDSPEIIQTIHLCKYRRMQSLCTNLSRLIIDAQFNPEDMVLCPVPLHWTRQFWRGFNQAERIAKQVSNERNIPIHFLLKRTRPTGHQAHRSRQERLRAVRDAFSVITKDIPASVILVDDLATTGATLDACAHALKRAGVQRVEGWVVAHG